MGRQVKVLLIGAAFTVVAMGFAYAVPRAMHTAAGGSSQDSIRLLTGTDESPVPSTSSDDCDEPVSSVDPSPSEPTASADPGASEEPSESGDPVASEETAASEEPPPSEGPVASQATSEAPAASEEPCDDGDGDEPEDPAEEEGDGNEGDEEAGSATNHGSAVRVAAHCDVHGRAHGELVRSVAQDKDATVASAERACADALSAEGATKDNAKPKEDKKSHVRKDAGKGGHGGGTGSSKEAHDPPAPKGAKPVKVKVSNDGSTSSAPGNPASKGNSKVKNK